MATFSSFIFTNTHLLLKQSKYVVSGLVVLEPKEKRLSPAKDGEMTTREERQARDRAEARERARARIAQLEEKEPIMEPLKREELTVLVTEMKTLAIEDKTIKKLKKKSRKKRTRNKKKIAKKVKKKKAEETEVEFRTRANKYAEDLYWKARQKAVDDWERSHDPMAVSDSHGYTTGAEYWRKDLANPPTEDDTDIPPAAAKRRAQEYQASLRKPINRNVPGQWHIGYADKP